MNDISSTRGCMRGVFWVFGGLPSVVQECCWDVCEKYVMGFLLLPVCQSFLNLMFRDFKLVVLLSVIWVGKGTPKACHALVPVWRQRWICLQGSAREQAGL